jgi:hypothetical protein
MRPVIGVSSQVTRSWPPDHVFDASPDSVGFRTEIGLFRAHGQRGIANIGQLTLDQEIEGSNPSSPASYSAGAVQRTPHTTSGGLVRRSANLNQRFRAAFVPGAEEDGRRRLGRGPTREELEAGCCAAIRDI